MAVIIPTTITATLTNDDILALPTTPFPVVAAPGAGKAVMVVGAVLARDFSAGALTENDADAGFAMSLTTATGANAVSTTADATDFADADATLQSVAAVSATLVENSAINLTLVGWDSDFTDGHEDNTLVVTVLYAVVDV